MPRSSQVPSVALPPRMQLVTTIQNRDATFDKDARLVNCYAEKEPVSEDYSVEKRVGLLEFRQLQIAEGCGIYFWAGNVYTVFGDTLYKGAVSVGTVDDTGGVYMFDELLGEGWLVLNNGVKAYYYDGVTLVEIPKFRTVLDGAFIVGSKYTIVTAGNSDFIGSGSMDNNPGTAFTATDLGDNENTGTAALTASSFLIGVRYEILTVGSTDFTLVGAASNTVGVRFTATGAGTGTGTVLSPNFPEGHVKGWAYLDGTLYVMDEGCKIYGTSTLSFGGIGGFDDPRVWDPLNVAVARTGPGMGIALKRHLSYVVAFKQSSTEFFYDAQNPTGSPLSPVQGAYSVYGCISVDSIQNANGTMCWITSSIEGAPQIVRLDELKVNIISTPAIERLLRFADFDEVASFTFTHSGHKFYGVTIKNENITLVFDLVENLWYHWTNAAGGYWPIVGHTSTFQDQASLVQHESNGKIYRVGADYIYPNDDGEKTIVDIYTPQFDGETARRKMLGAMFFIVDQQAGKLKVRVSDDDYQNWSNFREVDLSLKRPGLTNCGTFNKRAWNLRFEGNTAFRIKADDLQVDLGTL